MCVMRARGGSTVWVGSLVCGKAKVELDDPLSLPARPLPAR